MIKESSNFFGKLSERESYWLCIAIYNPITLAPLLKSTTHRTNLILIDQAIRNHLKQHPNDENYLPELYLYWDNMILDEHEFDWIDPTNERLCYWAWLYINKFNVMTQLSTAAIQPQDVRHTNYPSQENKSMREDEYWSLLNERVNNRWGRKEEQPDYSQDTDANTDDSMSNNTSTSIPAQDNLKPLVPILTNAKEKRTQTITSIDRILLPILSYEDKLRYITTMKSDLAYCISKVNHSWLNKENENQVDWAWDYFFDKIISTNDLDANICQKPITQRDKFNTIIACIDLCYTSEQKGLPIKLGNNESIEKVLERAKGAWRGKIKRDAKDTELAKELPITKQSQKQLIEIQTTMDQPIKKVLMDLIKDEYDKLPDQTKKTKDN